MNQVFGWALGATLVAVGVGGPLWWVTRSSAPEPEKGQLPTMDDAPDPNDPPKKTEFGTGTDDKGIEVKFDSERALKYLKQLCDIGPRISDTEGMKKQQELIEAHFKKLGATVTRQEFKAKQQSQKNQNDFVNLIISWHPDKAKRVLLTTHYDTRPIADQEANPKNWTKPFASANDGTSGVAFLMELGHHMKDLKSEYGVDFVLFDGEEFVFETNRFGGGDRYFIGSEHFADEYLKAKDKRKYKYEAGVLFDLFAGKDAALKVELYSWDAARPLVDQIWGVAKAVGAKSFKYEKGYEVQDDHLALNRVGIPTVDVIDFDYPHWHKLTDTADKVSGTQLAEVSKVITTWLQKIK
ncbi:M28 family peptidase [Gemmata sp. G18]|uniref:M28 family peptidase n=1 Tax=Gemmata palustris TaxID=2822762 RepID=A0ABS5BYY7_9BACT|nr:M28 family peptidase [Gemmata palustris]MBP3958909.1 M28 family peptidase [Gemmata palustris]